MGWTIQELVAMAIMDGDEPIPEMRQKRKRKLTPQQRERRRKYYAAHKEKFARMNAAYHRNCKDKIARRKARWYEQAGAAYREKQEARRARNRADEGIQEAAAFLVSYRKGARLTQAQLAERVHKSRTAVKDYENGRTPFDPAIFEAVFPGITRTIKEGGWI